MYFYEHTNGEIIRKPDAVVEPIGAERYFASPFVVKYWHEEDDKSEGLTESKQLKKAEK